MTYLRNFIPLVLVLFLITSPASGQPSRSLTLSLDDVIDMAQGETPDVLLAKTRFINQYWNFQAFNGSFKPQLDFTSTLPDYIRSIDPITLPDGSNAFVERSFMTTSAEVSLGQLIPGTGTFVAASTGISRIDLFGDQEGQSYLSSPISIRLSQPLFQFNNWKWDRQIEPLRFEEANKRYAEEMEALAYDAVSYFFDLYIAQLNQEAARLDKINADSLYSMSLGRFEVGRIAETDLLQIELNVQTAESAIARSSLEVRNSTEQLRNFLGIQEAIAFELLAPPEVPTLDIDPDRAVELAFNNRSKTAEFRRRLMEAERNVDRAYKDAGLNVDLTGSFGLSQTGPDLDDAYRDLLDQERLRIGISFPITDWGRSHAEKQIARSNLELTELNIAQERVDFEREVITHLQQYELIKQQSEISLRTYDVARKRLDLTQNRYYVGKIGTLDLNNALVEKERTRTAYYSSLKAYWLAYYRIRNLTLYDFAVDRPIDYNLPVTE